VQRAFFFARVWMGGMNHAAAMSSQRNETSLSLAAPAARLDKRSFLVRAQLIEFQESALQLQFHI